jgi:hypothetical protein
MELWIQEKYILLLSNRLEKFKRISPNVFNFRCPLCGDSENNKHRARGYFYKRDSDYFFHCHNCNRNRKFPTFLKQIEPELYYEMVTEQYREYKSPNLIEELTKLEKKGDVNCLNDLQKISQLPFEHSAYQFLLKRKISKEKYNDLYYCEDFLEFVNKQIPKKLTSNKHRIPRIIIPFYTKNGELFGFQGRAIDAKEEIRYISIILDESKPKAYNLNNINFNEKYYIVEGPFDSMFLPNCMAACGSDVLSVLNSIGCPKSNGVIVFDNEPRNNDITGNIENAINCGWKVCIWPKFWEYKDINDAIKADASMNDIQYLIDDNTFQGSEAKLKLAMWRKYANKISI